MALIDVRCLTASCGITTEVFRLAADWPKTPPCPKCQGFTEQVHLPPRTLSYAPAVVVYQAPDGTFRYPGEVGGTSTVKYEQLGYRRIEARGWADVRRVESQVNQQQAGEMRRRVERQCELHEAGVKVRRSDLFHGLRNGFMLPGHRDAVHLSAAGRDLAQAAIERNNSKSGPTVKESGFRVEAYSENRGNREESRDARGRRMRD